jgi:Zinc-ribbon containing domain
MIINTTSIKAHSLDGQESSGTLEILTFTSKQVFWRTFRKTLIALILTIISLFIPMAHFFLVPLGIMITISLCLRTYATKSMIQNGQVQCPSCQKQVKIMKRKYKLPFKDSCEHCHRELQIRAI